MAFLVKLGILLNLYEGKDRKGCGICSRPRSRKAHLILFVRLLRGKRGRVERGVPIGSYGVKMYLCSVF